LEIANESVKVTQLNFNCYAASERSYRKCKTNPDTHIAVQYSKGKSTNSAGIRSRNDDPHGLSGGAIWKWVRISADNAELRFLIGIIVEWDAPNAAVIGTKITFLIESMRSQIPELNAYLPNLSILTIVCSEDSEET
jgi:hypothetical protein